MRLGLLASIFILFFCACAQQPKDAPAKSKYKTPTSIGFVSDYEKNFSSAQKDSLRNLVEAFEKETGIEIAIATFDTTMVSKTDFNDFTLATANDWGVGKKDENNGILIGFSKGHRMMRINNGYGIEKLISDEETQEIMNKYFISNFKKDLYFKGTFEGTKALEDLLRTKIKK